MAKAKEASHVAPENLPFQAAPEPVAPTTVIKVKESCANCRGALMREGMLFCHGKPPTGVYRQIIIGVGAVGDPIWPKMDPNDWCMAWEMRMNS